MINPMTTQPAEIMDEFPDSKVTMDRNDEGAVIRVSVVTGEQQARWKTEDDDRNAAKVVALLHSQLSEAKRIISGNRNPPGT